MVHLPHHQASPDLERQAHHGVVGRRDGLALERLVRPRVRHRLVGREVEEGQERSGQDQEEEAVQGDLAEHERPVVRKDLPQVPADERASVQALVDPLHPSPYDHGGRSQKLGPTGAVKSLRARIVPSGSIWMGSCGRGRAAGPYTGRAPFNTSKVD